MIWERPVLVFTYVRPERFLARLPEIRTLLHDMGRQTRQGEVALEFDGTFYRIRDFDEP
jgi:hypothetical protein